MTDSAPTPAAVASGTTAPTCPFISTNASSSGLQLALHPLALLTISDYITRHALRNIQGPIVGALLGTQSGREVSIEHAYEVMVSPPDAPAADSAADTPAPILDHSFFTNKLSLFKETHPTLDLLGWFATTSSPHFHPHAWHLALHQQLLTHNESPVLLLLNPAPAASIGGKLPLALYESIYEADGALRFAPLKYTIETGEAEMIGVDVVARGGGNATEETAAPPPQKDSGKGKGKAKDTLADIDALATPLGPHNEELLSQLTSKRNAITMLHSRIRLLLKYLTDPPEGGHTPQLLRELKSLTHSRLPLLTPSNAAEFEAEKNAEEADVNLVVLLGTLTKNLEQLRSMGRKFAAADTVMSRRGDKGSGEELYSRVGMMGMSGGGGAGG
ncbi:hypothetical protein EDC01DRAFT_782390 [Geopyxis carbonaria]|nr:hypothetical protein EDC01DRAFT_782390 [Geopyxis carbonaria]